MLKHPDEIRGAYAETRTAEDYIDHRFTSAWGSVLHGAQVRTVNNLIRDRGLRSVLELAPGPARVSSSVRGFQRGYLCEFNESMVTVARRRLAGHDGWRVVRGDGFHLPFRPAPALDLVYSFRFIRHFEAANRALLYSEVRSVLKDDGWFVFDAVTDPVGRRWHHRFASGDDRVYDEFYTREGLAAELDAHGFSLVSLTGVMRHMPLQYRIQVLVDPRSHRLARGLIALLDHVPGAPLEWIATCRKRPR